MKNSQTPPFLLHHLPGLLGILLSASWSLTGCATTQHPSATGDQRTASGHPQHLGTPTGTSGKYPTSLTAETSSPMPPGDLSMQIVRQQDRLTAYRLPQNASQNHSHATRSLYEDAITLSRTRATLAQMVGSECAEVLTVKRGVVTIRVTKLTPAQSKQVLHILLDEPDVLEVDLLQ